MIYFHAPLPNVMLQWIRLPSFIKLYLIKSNSLPGSGISARPNKIITTLRKLGVWSGLNVLRKNHTNEYLCFTNCFSKTSNSLVKLLDHVDNGKINSYL